MYTNALRYMYCIEKFYHGISEIRGKFPYKSECICERPSYREKSPSISISDVFLVNITFETTAFAPQAAKIQLLLDPPLFVPTAIATATATAISIATATAATITTASATAIATVTATDTATYAAIATATAISIATTIAFPQYLSEFLIKYPVTVPFPYTTLLGPACS